MIEYLSEIETRFENILACLFLCQKSRDTIPLISPCFFNLYTCPGRIKEKENLVILEYFAITWRRCAGSLISILPCRWQNLLGQEIVWGGGGIFRVLPPVWKRQFHKRWTIEHPILMFHPGNKPGRFVLAPPPKKLKIKKLIATINFLWSLHAHMYTYTYYNVY